MKIKNRFKWLNRILFIIFFLYLFTILYSFLNIYLSFKNEDADKLNKFLNKTELSLSFQTQLNSIVYEKIKSISSLSLIYSLDKKNFDKILDENIKNIAFFLSDEKQIIYIYKNPNLIKKYIDGISFNKTESLSNNKNHSIAPNYKKSKFKIMGPNIPELYKDTNYFFLTNLNSFKLDFIHKDLNIIVTLKLDKILWKLSSIIIKI